MTKFDAFDIKTNGEVEHARIQEVLFGNAGACHVNISPKNTR